METAIVKIKKGEARALKAGGMWIYDNEIDTITGEFTNGDIVTVEDFDGYILGRGFINTNSKITVRMMTRKKDTEINEAFIEMRVRNAREYRKATSDTGSCRLIFGEADQLPGLTVDRYNDILVSQISSYGLEQRGDMLYEVLLEVLREDGQDVKGIYERNDIRVRAKEGLPLEKGYWKQMKLPTTTIIDENGLKLHVDVENGQKTGYFLDQKANRVLLREMAHGKRVMDCCSHTGGFALNAAYGNASQAVAVDVSQTALDHAYANAKLNHLENRISFVKADVFKYLDTCKEGQFDIIVLDPPAFTKSRRTIDHAYSGYKRINKQAMMLLGRGGYLITCSCSRFMEIENFEKMLRESAQEAGVTLKQVSVTQQNHDHPILWTMEETSYLKFYIFQIV